MYFCDRLLLHSLAGFEFMAILLPRPSECWDSRYEPPSLPFVFLFLNYLMLLRELTTPDILKRKHRPSQSHPFCLGPTQVLLGCQTKTKINRKNCNGGSGNGMLDTQAEEMSLAPVTTKKSQVWRCALVIPELGR